ncbi:hypothetical protein TASIC1_0010032800 [Trichoderma asperellum]|uniref:Uncharacterized protein n=1 Tax=Trichoderma asperellum TaxID=101201 RepID=A0A6V8R0J7_TRIAP|nr:hypothetical protein LI328DRAFT_165554 [Trichoderma asperelloides]GFP58517.1 hypothetical protein TASIC1_0010032800 [Trichoderma asperellum]
MKTATVLLALVAAAFAAPTNVEEPTLAKRGCAAGDICISGTCYVWSCGPVGCSVGGSLVNMDHEMNEEDKLEY